MPHVQSSPSIKLLVSQLEELEGILLHEQEALTREDFELLDICSEKKLAITAAIQKTEEQQGNSIIALINTTEHTLPGSANQLQQAVSQLHELSSRCKQLNLVNGALLESRRRNIQIRLNILRGHTHGTSLYSDKGTSISTDNGQTLARV